jgi:hypothetical protein
MGVGAISRVDCELLWGYIRKIASQEEPRLKKASLLLFDPD